MGAYGANTHTHAGSGSAAQQTSGNAYGIGGTTRADSAAVGLLSQGGVSHSALVNSGNAAILGHNSFKLNS